MKVIIVLALLVITGGAGAAYIAYQHQQHSSDEIRNTILNATNALKQADNTTNTAILESRYGLRPDYDELAAKVYRIHSRLRRFQRGQLADYAETNANIQQQLLVLQGQLELKIELIESFKSHNAILRNSIQYAPSLGEQLIREARSKKNALAIQQLSTVNEAVYRWVLYNDESQANIIEANANGLIDHYNAVNDGTALVRYVNHVSTVVEEQGKIQTFIDKILAVESQSSIAILERLYLDHYVAVISESRQSLYYVLLYAMMVLAIAIYLGVKLKRSYAALKSRDSYRSQHISVAHKHLSSADQNVTLLKEALLQIRGTLKYIGGIANEAQKPSYDNKKIGALLSRALKRYRSLEKNNVLNQADDMLDKSNRNLENASGLIKDLAAH